MAQPGVFEDLLPPLLNRLCDDNPLDQTPEPPAMRSMGADDFRNAVMEDLRQLLNTIAWPEIEVPSLGTGALRQRKARNWLNYLSPLEYPAVAGSVLNFGVPPVYDFWESDAGTLRLQRMVTKAIERFEPRISLKRNGVTVLRREHLAAQPNMMAIRIEGTLWAQPTPIELVLRSDLDLEHREARISVLEEAR